MYVCAGQQAKCGVSCIEAHRLRRMFVVIRLINLQCLLKEVDYLGDNHCLRGAGMQGNLSEVLRIQENNLLTRTLLRIFLGKVTNYIGQVHQVT